MILSVIYSQDRSLIFTTGSPIGTEGYTIQWDGRGDLGRNLSSGIYFYTIKTEKMTKTSKMILMK